MYDKIRVQKSTQKEDSGSETLLEIDSEIDSEYLDWAITTSADHVVT